MSKFLKTVFLTLLFIAGITFSAENTQPFVVRYYFGLETPPMPLFLLILFSVLLGVFLAGVGFVFDRWSLKKALREKDREITALEKQLKFYRDAGGVVQG